MRPLKEKKILITPSWNVADYPGHIHFDTLRIRDAIGSVLPQVAKAMLEEGLSRAIGIGLAIVTGHITAELLDMAKTSGYQVQNDGVAESRPAASLPADAKPELVVLIGPSGSGKTTLITKRYQKHITFDGSSLITAIWGSLQYHAQLKRMVKGMIRKGVAVAVEEGLSMVVPISGRTRKERSRITDIARGRCTIRIVKLGTTAKECIERCKADKSRPKSTKWKPIVERWFRVYEPVTNDECDRFEEL